MYGPIAFLRTFHQWSCGFLNQERWGYVSILCIIYTYWYLYYIYTYVYICICINYIYNNIFIYIYTSRSCGKFHEETCWSTAKSAVTQKRHWEFFGCCWLLTVLQNSYRYLTENGVNFDVAKEADFTNFIWHCSNIFGWVKTWKTTGEHQKKTGKWIGWMFIPLKIVFVAIDP